MLFRSSAALNNRLVELRAEHEIEQREDSTHLDAMAAHNAIYEYNRIKLIKEVGVAIDAENKKEEKHGEMAAKHAAAEARRREEKAARFNENIAKEDAVWTRHYEKIVALNASALEKMEAHPLNFHMTLGADSFKPLIDSTVKLTAAERAALPTKAELARVTSDLSRLLPNLTKAELGAKAAQLSRNSAIIQQITLTGELMGKTRAHRLEMQKLKEMEYEAVMGKKMSISMAQSWKEALDRQVEAVKQDTAATAQNIAVGVAGLIGGRRAQAAVEGAFSTAKAVEMWARFAASWGTDVGAGLAATQYTIAAAEYFKVAGSGGGGAHGGGGGGGGGRGSTRSESASQKRDSQPGVVMGQSGGAGSGGGSHGYSTTTINVTGGMISADTMQQFAAKFGVGQTGGLYRINANSTSSLPASRA